VCGVVLSLLQGLLTLPEFLTSSPIYARRKSSVFLLCSSLAALRALLIAAREGIRTSGN
jgi:hypothetical protein